MNWVSVTAVLLFVTLPGCVMVREGKVRPPVPWPPSFGEHTKSTIALVVTEEGFPGSQPGGTGQVQDPFREQAVKARRDRVAKTYGESGLFSSVVTTGEQADLLAEITVQAEESAGFPWSAAFSILTLTMIPGHVTQDLVVTTTYKDRKQRVLGGVEQREEFGSWIQFFLLFAMPFANGPDAMMDDARYDMHRWTILEAHSKGIF